MTESIECAMTKAEEAELMQHMSEQQRITELEAELKQLQDAARELAEQDCAQCPGYSYDPEDCWPEQRCPVGWLRKLLPCEKVTNDDA